VILVLDGMTIVMDLYSSLEGWREWQRERERKPVRRREIMLVSYGNSVTWVN